ncbi:MAG: hypothetical protein ACJZ4Q_02830 [Candidatus Thalassarchaeaceae archaeon]
MSEKRKVTVDGEEFEVEISPGEGVWEVSIEGRTYSVEVEGTRGSTKRKKRVAKSTRRIRFWSYFLCNSGQDRSNNGC